MNPDQQVRLLFEQAIELDPHQREAFLDRVDGESEVVAEVRALLSVWDENSKFLEERWFDPARIHWHGLFDDDPGLGEDLLDQRVGSYHIQAVLGAGGMGVVYRAEQDKPTRTVALKVIRPGFLSSDALRRFEYEVSVLGRLQHPGIAQIFDSGTSETPSGVQPYFAMEFIEGATLLEFARCRRLSSQERIELFIKICDAVQHAHQKGVIHRDLKPGNILVDEWGQPKVLDFGVARATNADLQITTAHTVVGQIIGTAHYMSPEQAIGDPDELDTRSDVYSLGVILYELLTEALPYDLEGKLMYEVVRVIREDPPIALGLKRNDLRGDVETVVGKALEKEKSRRYPSSSAFADDLRRFLHDEPIAARPPSAVYQLKKFAQRNTTLVAGVATTFLALVIGLVTTFYFYRQAGDREHDARMNFARAREAESAAKENEIQARKNEAKARSNENQAKANAELAHKRLEEFTLRDDIHRLRELLDRANELWPPYPEHIEPLEEWLEEAKELLSRRGQHRINLHLLREQATVSSADSWKFNDPATQRQHDAIVSHLANLEQFDTQNDLLFAGYGLNYGIGIARDSDGNYISERNVYWGLCDAVERRLDLALTVWEESIDQYQDEWDEAIASIADPRQCPQYNGLEIGPQVGLVPIGQNSQSGLWEFAHIWSGSIPETDADGQIVMAADNCIVLVLVLGGIATLGTDLLRMPELARHLTTIPDIECTSETVALDPFFISKYEMSQAQWILISGTNPSRIDNRAFPVANVSWTEAELLLTRVGLCLPTEAQWEFSVRGGTTTLWWCGNDPHCMTGFANVHDVTENRISGREIVSTDYDDGIAYLTTVGSLKPNPFGLHETCGNVREWCHDLLGSYDLFDAMPGTGERVVTGMNDRVLRGGGYRNPIECSRPAFRWSGSPGSKEDDVGLRPARRLDP